VNIEIMRAFVQLRKLIDTNKELTKKSGSLMEYDAHLRIAFKAVRELMRENERPNRK